MTEIIGIFSSEVVATLKLDIPTGTEILLSVSTLEHIKTSHPDIIGDHRAIIADIITAPSGVSLRVKDCSIGFFKCFENGSQYYLELSVRSSSKGEYFVRTLHHIERGRLEKRVKNGKIILIDESALI